jgi:hypothetical protein
VFLEPTERSAVYPSRTRPEGMRALASSPPAGVVIFSGVAEKDAYSGGAGAVHRSRAHARSAAVRAVGSGSRSFAQRLDFQQHLDCEGAKLPVLLFELGNLHLLFVHLTLIGVRFPVP